MDKNFIISGAGGQGVLSIGSILANVFLLSNKNVSYCTCYGAEMRGGAVNCEVNMSDSELLCVQNSEFDYVIALNQESFDKFLPKVRKGGCIIVNSSMVNEVKPREDIEYIFAPLTKEANNMGNVKVANSIALGILSKLLSNFSLDIVKLAYEKILKNKTELIQKNLDAFIFGLNYAL